MSLSELQAYYTSSHLIPKPSKSGLYKILTRTKKRSLVKVRRVKIRTISAYRRQYILTTAFKDTRKAAANNEDILIMSLTSVVVLLFASIATISQVLLNFFLTAFILSESISVNLLTIAIGAASALLVLYGWFSAFLANLISISVMDGLTKKAKRSVRLTFRKSLASASRTATAWLLLLSLILIPLGIVAVIGYFAIQLHPVSITGLISILQYVIILSIIWFMYVLLNYSLIPYVSLFERGHTYRGMIKRSRQLVTRKGRIFILALHATFTVVSSLIYLVSVFAQNMLAINKWVVFAGLILPLALLFNCLMVTFYRKRRLARIN